MSSHGDVDARHEGVCSKHRKSEARLVSSSCVDRLQCIFRGFGGVRRSKFFQLGDELVNATRMIQTRDLILVLVGRLLLALQIDVAHGRNQSEGHEKCDPFFEHVRVWNLRKRMPKL